MTDAAEAAGLSSSARRLLRALSRGGRRLLRVAGAEAERWGVFERGDRRTRAVAGGVEADVAALRAAGLIEAAADGEGLVAAGRAPFERAAAEFDPDRFAPAARRGRGAGGVGFLGLARAAAEGRGPLDARRLQAARRLIADIELAGVWRSGSMNWDATPVGRGRRSGAGAGGGAAGGPGLAVEARARLRRLEAVVGGWALRIAAAACAGGMTLGALERRFGLAARSAGEELADALDAIADAYDRRVSPGPELGDVGG